MLLPLPLPVPLPLPLPLPVPLPLSVSGAWVDAGNTGTGTHSVIHRLLPELDPVRTFANTGAETTDRVVCNTHETDFVRRTGALQIYLPRVYGVRMRMCMCM